MIKFNKKVVLVTGAGNGLGLFIGEQFAKLGYFVYMHYRSNSSLKNLTALKSSYKNRV